MPTATTTKPAAFLDAPRAGRLNIQYAPANGDSIVENPPRFTWLPVIEETARYVLRVSTDPKFPKAKTQLFTDLPLNFLTPDAAFAPGDYHWSYAVWDAKTQTPTTSYSETRAFTVATDLPQTPLPDRASRYAASDMAHPRLWLGPKQLAAFRKSLKKDANHCGWETFFEKSVQPWLDRDISPEPAPYPDNKRTPPIWRATYVACQELIYAIRHLAIAGHVTDDAAMRARARDWLLAVADWDPAGTTSRSYTDEWAFRVNVALAWGYDWLHAELSEDERTRVRSALLIRTRETADHVIKHANIHLFPYDSHAVRAVSAVLIPACIALLDEEAEARDWLDYSIEFLFTVYSPWGDADGGWAEGPHYWMTGMAYLIEAANLLKSFVGIDLFQRPFLQKTGDFPFYTKPPDLRRGTFGDDSTMGDPVCLKLGYNLRQFAGITGNGAFQWYFEEVRRNDPGTEMASYNYGWWDLNFDDMMYRHDYPQITAVPPRDIPKMRWFKGIGWVAIQHRMDDRDEHIHFVMKSSPFGSISHSHGDQNAFCLSAFGEDLAIQSGHYVAFNSSMHQTWRRQTRSKNALLINGKGQYADRDKAQQMQSTGQIELAEERGDHIYIRGNATPAYQSLSPEVSRAVREVYFVQNSYFVIVDSIDAEKPVEIDWLLHTNAPNDLGSNSFRNTGQRAGFYGQVIWSEAGNPTLSQHTGFAGVDPAEYAGLPESTCLTARYPAAKRHRIATLIVPYPKAAPRRVFSFLDDQGYDCDLYFTDANEHSFKVVVQKLART
jgi:hypothetical protein